MQAYGKRQPKAKVSSDSTAVADNEMSVMLKNITVTASRGVARKTPIAMSDVDRKEVENKLGNNELPEMLNLTPGVYATKNSGAYGDSKLNMRGFQNSNVAVMVNGVPVNDMEHGGLYWSNWGGLGEMVRYMQTQRGLGASKVSVPSIGGTVNIVTKTTDSKRGGYATYSVGNDGFNHVSASFSTGLTKSGWNFSMLFGKKWGDGYIQGTDFTDYDYFFAVSKRLGQHHQIALTGFGSPQSHYQRNPYDGLSVEGWQDVKRFMGGKSVYRYNPTYGFGKNGERKSSAFNFYHKPQFSLNHIWLIDDKSSLNTALYMSIGHGYGNSGQGINSTYANSWYGAANGKLRYDFRHADGTFAYDQVQELNEQSDAGSKMVMAQSFNDHIWYGLLSTYTRQLAKGLDFYAGFDMRSYKGTHTAKISDLYNGAYYTDLRYRSSVNPANNAAALDPNWQYEKLSVGDVVFRDYDSHIVQHGVFSQLEYSKDRITAFVSGTLATSRMDTHKAWHIVGLMGVITGFLITGYYAVVSGWCLQYIFASGVGELRGDPQYIASYFADFSASPLRPVFWTVVVFLLTHVIIVRGVRGGIEKASKALMPTLFLLLLVVVVCSCLLPGGAAGIEFLFKPDFSKVTGSVFLAAMGQAFYSLGLSMGCICTFASYFSRPYPSQDTVLCRAPVYCPPCVPRN
jgi:hypothetical protein